MNNYLFTQVEIKLLKTIDKQGLSCVTMDFLHGAVKVHGTYIDYAELNATLNRLKNQGYITDTDITGTENYKTTEKCRQHFLELKEKRHEQRRTFWTGFISGSLSTVVGGWLLSLLVH